MATINKLALRNDGSATLTTDNGIAIEVTPRVLLDTEQVTVEFPGEFSPDKATAFASALVVGHIADLTDRIQLLESRLSSVMEFIKNLNALANKNQKPTDEANERAPQPAIQLAELTL